VGHLQVSGDSLPVWISGRFGRRRVRVTECAVVLKAETFYDGLVRDRSHTLRPGQRGTSTVTLRTNDGQRAVARRVTWVTLPNRVWRCGRVFYECPRCHGRATRLYAPTLNCELQCRRCWGLTYQRRTLWNYKRSGLWFFPGLTLADWARASTADHRREALAAARTRQAARRRALARQLAARQE
jgi:hypothetical protein